MVALDDKRDGLPSEELFQCRLNGVKVLDLVNFFEQEAGKILVDFATPGWMSFADGFTVSASSKIAKRWFDICASFVMLLLHLAGDAAHRSGHLAGGWLWRAGFLQPGARGPARQDLSRS